MDPLLLALTIVSLFAALGFGALAWHLLREERRRSDARVAALVTAIEEDDPRPQPGRAPAAMGPVAVSGLFAPVPSAAAHGSPPIKAAVGLAMAIALIVAVAMVNRRPEGDASGRDALAAAADDTSAPLELISMQHAREGNTLTVIGLVRNPRAGADVSRVTAVVLAFNRSGALVATGRAALDITTLAPGDESPFVVTIPGLPDVGRYRVSFRTEAGVIRHVDRRGDATRLVAAAHTQ